MIVSCHPSFSKEMNDFLTKHHQDTSWFLNLQNLLTNHYETQKVHLDPRVLIPIGTFEEYQLMKISMAVGGVRKNQCPRVCFAKYNSSLIFLCFGTHIDNYNTEKDLIQKGKNRLEEIISFNRITK